MLGGWEVTKHPPDPNTRTHPDRNNQTAKHQPHPTWTIRETTARRQRGREPNREQTHTDVRDLALRTEGLFD